MDGNTADGAERMHDFEIILILLAAALGLTILAQWLKLPYPILLVSGGLLLSLQPYAPEFVLAPDVVFLVFLPPLLYGAAFNTHWPRFRRQLRAITLLAVGLVLFTTTAVAWVAHDFVGLDWGPAFVLGAVVSPPDAVAAIAVTKRLRVPKIISTLLEGESLVNDASALVAYRMAVAAVVTGVFSLEAAGISFVKVSVGGVIMGFLMGIVIEHLSKLLERSEHTDHKFNIAATLLAPYAAYLPAEHLGFSGVLAVVVAGLWIGSRHRKIFSRELMVEARAVWETMDFILNGLIFILIGFQLPAILKTLSVGRDPWFLLQGAVIVAAAVILTRILWVFPGAYGPRWLDRRILGRGDPYPPWELVTVVAWTGMRGVVSLAAAMAIPLKLADGVTDFPQRDLIQFLTFWVIFATLVGQGLTLPLLIRLLGIEKREELYVDPNTTEVPRLERD